MRSLRSPSLLGKRFNRLIVIGRTENKKGPKKWICKCDCGNQITATKFSLEHPERGCKSCGCLNDEVRKDKITQWNKDHTGDKHPKYVGLITKKNGYQIQKIPGHPCADKRGYVQIHNLIAYEAGCYTPNSSNCIHHADKIRNNNDSDNLVPFDSQMTHQIYHSEMEKYMFKYLKDNNLLDKFFEQNPLLKRKTVKDFIDERERRAGDQLK